MNLNDILSLLSPREAEAKVLADKRALEILRGIMENPSEEYLPKTHKRIVQEANRIPQEVNVREGLKLRDVTGGVGAFYGDDSTVLYDPELSNPDLTHTLPHELTHFLDAAKGLGTKPTKQHDIIELLLGAKRYKPAAELQGYQKPLIPPGYEEIIRQWLGQ